MKNDKWKIWDNNNKYGETLYKRATGELPEMESSKALAKIIQQKIGSPEKILDVGCGAGHYLKSLRNQLKAEFIYTGVDATKNYIELAKKAFADDREASFFVSDIYNLEVDDKSNDLVISCNLLLHLPAIVKPINELVRVAKDAVIIRLLCGERSFRIQDVHPEENGNEFTEDGNPINYYYYNIYSKDYLKNIFSKIERIDSYEIIDDLDYNCENIVNSIEEHQDYNATRLISGYQVNGYILQPWAFVILYLK
ncbi:MAG: hypothetical protein PWP52_1129 [Bacteroidales bacterium]|nr:hypothetical protein [Bacteroidales bacterium]